MQGLGWVLCRVGRRHQDQLHNQALVLCFLVYGVEGCGLPLFYEAPSF